MGMQNTHNCSSFKGALSRYSVILCRFFAVENGSEETRGRGAGQREAGQCRTFFFTSFELRDQSTLGYQSVTLAKSFLSRTKMGFEIRSRKWKQKDKFAHEKWGKFMETKKGLRTSTDRSWVLSCLGPKIVQDSRGIQVQLRISLHSTMYTAIIDRQDTCWARFAWNDARPPLFFPTTKWRKKSLNSVTVHL